MQHKLEVPAEVLTFRQYLPFFERGMQTGLVSYLASSLCDPDTNSRIFTHLTRSDLTELLSQLDARLDPEKKSEYLKPLERAIDFKNLRARIRLQLKAKTENETKISSSQKEKKSQSSSKKQIEPIKVQPAGPEKAPKVKTPNKASTKEVSLNKAKRSYRPLTGIRKQTKDEQGPN